MAFWENPLLILAVGGSTAAILGYVWLQNPRRDILAALIGVILLMAGGVWAAWFVETDREAVTKSLSEAARAVARNDLAATLRKIHPNAPSIRTEAEAVFPRIEFHEVNIKSDLEVTLDNQEPHQEATAKFHVTIAGSERDGLITNWRVPRVVTVKFRKAGDEWLITGYSHEEVFQKQ